MHKLSDYYRAISAGILVQDINGLITYANPAACSILSVDESSILGKSSQDDNWNTYDEAGNLLPGDMHPAIVAIRTGIPVRNFVIQLLNANNERSRWILVDSEPILHARTGKVRYVVTTFLDITKRKTAEMAQHESELKLLSLLNSAPFGTQLYDLYPDDRLVLSSVNESACRMLNMDCKALVGLTIEEAFPALAKTDIPSIYRKVARTGEMYEANDIAHDQGDINRAYQIIAFQPSPNRVGVFFKDTTERNKAEDALRKNESLLRALVENLPFDVWVIDKEERYLLQNSMSIQHWGNAVGKGPEEIVKNPEMLKNWTSINKRVLSGETVRKDDSYIFNNERCYISQIITPFRDGDEIVGIVGLNIDETERKRAQEAKREFEKKTELQKRQFYRKTIYSVTEGKLCISDFSEIKLYLKKADTSLELHTPPEISDVRHKIEDYCLEKGVSHEVLYLFILGVGEAITNAIKYSKKVCVYAGIVDHSVWVCVSDNGKGIESLILPKAVLRKGFSTRPSLGYGYTIMLESADKIILQTGSHGTNVILEKKIMEDRDADAVAVNNITDTW